MPTLKEILADIENYGDDEEIEVKGVKVKVGDIRAYTATENQAVIAAINERKSALDAMQADLESRAEQVAALQAELEQAKGANTGKTDVVQELINRLRGPEKKTMLDLTDDEFFGPAAKEVRALRSERDALAKQIKEFQDTYQGNARWLVERELRKDFAALPDKPKELTFEQLVKHATQRRYQDQSGYLDLQRAYEDVQAPVIREKTKKELRAEVEKEVRAEQAKQAPEFDASDIRGHTFIPRPSGNGSGKGAAAAKPKGYGGIEKIPTDEILADPAISALFQQ